MLIEEIKEKFREMDPSYKIDKIINNLSTGGRFERKIKQKVGKIANKNIEKKFDPYAAIDKIHKNIEKRYCEGDCDERY
jgi:hypothetical protein